jgi:hypothetical protein
MELLLVIYKHGYANAPHYYVVHTLAVLLVSIRMSAVYGDNPSHSACQPLCQWPNVSD